MWFRTLTRREFVDLLRSEQSRDWGYVRESVRDHRFQAESPDGLTLLWREQPESVAVLPSVISVEDDARRDFLAWVLTYLPDFRPFTSLFRIVNREIANAYLNRPTSPIMGPWENACLGLIVAEAASYSGIPPETRQLGPVACSGTCSFAMAKGLANNLSIREMSEIPSAWGAARLLTKQSALSLKPEHLKLPWSVLIALQTGHDQIEPFSINDSLIPIVTTCRDLRNGKELSPHALEGLLDGPPDVRNRLTQLGRTREEKVEAYEILSREVLSGRHRNPVMTAFALAYIVSQIGPGTLEHFQLLTPTLPVFPMILLWYGLLAGLSPQSQMQKIGNGLGRRIARDMLVREDFLDRPTCDIALSELEIVMTAETTSSEIRIGAQGHLEIELVPSVNTIVRWPPRHEGQADLFQSRVPGQGAQELMFELNDVMNEAEVLRSRLSRVLNVPEQPRRKPEKRNKR